MATALHAPKAAPRKKGSNTLSGFAYVDKNGVGHLPLFKNGKPDRGHVGNARARLNQTDFSNPKSGTAAEAKARALAKIVAAEKRLGMGGAGKKKTAHEDKKTAAPEREFPDKDKNAAPWMTPRRDPTDDPPEHEVFARTATFSVAVQEATGNDGGAPEWIKVL